MFGLFELDFLKCIFVSICCAFYQESLKNSMWLIFCDFVIMTDFSWLYDNFWFIFHLSGLVYVDGKIHHMALLISVTICSLILVGVIVFYYVR